MSTLKTLLKTCEMENLLDIRLSPFRYLAIQKFPQVSIVVNIVVIEVIKLAKRTCMFVFKT